MKYNKLLQLQIKCILFLVPRGTDYAVFVHIGKTKEDAPLLHIRPLCDLRGFTKDNGGILYTRTRCVFLHSLSLLVCVGTQWETGTPNE